MIRSLLLLFLLQYTQPLYIPTHTSSVVGTPTVETGCTFAVSNPQNAVCTTGTMSAGDVILIDYTVSGAVTPVYTDSTGNTVTPISQQSWIGGGSTDAIAYVKNANAGAHTITVSASGGGSFPTMTVVAWKHVDTTSPLENFSMTNGASNGTVITASPVTSTTAGALVFAFSQIASGSATVSAGSGYTIVSTFTPGANAQSEFAIQTGTFSPTFNVSGLTGAAWFVDAIAIKAGP